MRAGKFISMNIADFESHRTETQALALVAQRSKICSHQLHLTCTSPWPSFKKASARDYFIYPILLA